ncbi:MAG: hypothetical protein IPH39_20165 [Sulfuritalea sp.]|nr:hypothetical protein [Sulfuritalea sp.]MBK8762703.1 hypothetical protein [Sulfuritalea sp.]MBK9352230.1 hypothetical protein [Sulfuritalea sp.]
MNEIINFVAKFAAAPVRRAILRFALERVVGHPRFRALRVVARRTPRVPTARSRQPLLASARLPCCDETRVATVLMNAFRDTPSLSKRISRVRLSCATAAGALALQAGQLLPFGFAQGHFSPGLYGGYGPIGSME